MLAANAELEIRLARTTSAHAHLDQLSDPGLINRAERIGRQNAAIEVRRQERTGIVSTQRHRRLREIVGPEAEELGVFGDIVGDQRRSRHLDHRADEVIDALTCFFEDFVRRLVDDRLLSFQFLWGADERDHDLRDRDDPFLPAPNRGAEDRSCLHTRDFRPEHTDPASAQSQHRILFAHRFDAISEVVRSPSDFRGQ